MRANRTKQRLEEGEVVFGCMLQQYGLAEVPRTLAAAGFDFVFLDTEHGAFGMETVRDMIRAGLERGITPLVRVSELHYSQVARMLDAGAQGIVFPRVESPELLAQAISWTRFPPAGVRGYGLAPPQIEYEQRSFGEIIEHANSNTMAVVQFETRTALDRRDELLAVPGVHVALVGPADLSISLGIPGQFEHPTMVGAILGLMETCKRRGIAPGIQVRTAELAKIWAQRGMRMIGCGSEHAMLLAKAQETVAGLTAAVKAAATAT